MKRRELLASAAAALCLPAIAQTYPSRPVRLVLPFPAGGSVDVLGRGIAQRLSARLGQTVVVENQAGAGGMIGAGAVAKAPKDGYTLLLSSSSTHSLAAALKSQLAYDPQKDFAPIIEVANGKSSILIPESLPVRTVAELVAYMKKRGNQNTYGSAGVGTLAHLNAEDFMRVAGVEATHVPYKGTSLAAQDLGAERLTFMFDSTVSAQSLTRTGRIRMLAVTGARRVSKLPDVPTLVEAGVRMTNPEGYFGLWAPGGTPSAIVQQLNTLMNEILQSADMRATLEDQSATAAGGTPEAFAQRVARDTDLWRQAVQRAGVQAE